MAKMPRVLPVEEVKPKVDITLGGIEYPDGKFVCMLCFRKPDFRAKVLSEPVFKVSLTGKERCSICSKYLKDAFIINDVAD